MMHSSEYQSGYATTGSAESIWIGYRAEADGRHAIYVQEGVGRAAEGSVRSPAEILAFRPVAPHTTISGGEIRTAFEQEPPGWFERKCKEANSEWFVPFVQRMAGGESVPLEEIQAA